MRRLPERGAARLGMHVDDVGADGDVDGDRHVEPRGRGEDRKVRVRHGRHGVLDRLAEADRAPRLRRRGEKGARLLRHPELAARDARPDLFRRAPHHRDLVVVDGGRAVEQQRRHVAALHEVGEQRGEAHLDDVAPHPPHDPAPGGVRLGRGRRQFAQVGRLEDVRQ